MKLKNAERIVLSILMLEWLICVFSGVTFSSLSGDNFYDIKADIFYWIPFLSGIPQLIMQHHFVGVLIDVMITVCIIFQIRYPYKTFASRFLFPLLFLFYITLTAYLTHRNYPSGIFIVIIPFMFGGAINRKFTFEAIRYYLLWFYFSAGCLKIFSGSILEVSHFSHFLTHQFAPYYVENNLSWRTFVNQYLIHHHAVAYSLFLGSVLIELSAVAGFFTRRYDKWLMAVFFLFHICNWMLMDISFVGQAAFIAILLITNSYAISQATKR